MNKKILIPVVLLLVLGGVYKFVLAKPKAGTKEPKKNVEGEVYVLPKDFLVNLAGGKYAKFSVALVFEKGHGLTDAAAEAPSAPGATVGEALAQLDREAQTTRDSAPAPATTAPAAGTATLEPAGATGEPVYMMASGGAAKVEPPEGYGPLPQEAIIRAIITDETTGAPSGELTSAHGREELGKRILKRFKKQTDVHVHEIFFTDITVQ